MKQIIEHRRVTGWLSPRGNFTTYRPIPLATLALFERKDLFVRFTNDKVFAPIYKLIRPHFGIRKMRKERYK